MSAAIGRLQNALAGRYGVERELGAGGMATVYLAHDVRHDRNVALKVLHAELGAVIGAERFLQEIRTTARLQHPHILGLIDSGEADGLLFYVMPYVPGESLRALLSREKQLPVPAALRIATEVASALDYAHRQGVVHRDVKPENVLLHDGQALVADFGIALAVSAAGGSRMTQTGLSLGTPQYMSPEQALGERNVGPRADVYALGAMTYEMLTGDPPFIGSTAQAILARVMTEKPTPPSAARDTVPPHVEAAILIALAKLPADRWESAKAFAEALGNPASHATAATTAAVPAVSWRRRPSLVAGWSVALLAGIAALWGWLRPPPPASVLRQYISLWSHPQVPGAISLGAAISRDGSRIAFVDSAGGNQLWIKERDQLEPVRVTGASGVSAPAFSPNGEWIAYVADGKLRKIPRTGGSFVPLADSINAFLGAIAWLDNGSILFTNRRFDLMAVGEDGGAPRVVSPATSLGGGAVSIAGLPGGRTALLGLCTPRCGKVRLAALDVTTGETTPLVDEGVRAWSVERGRIVFVRRDGGVFVAPFDERSKTFRSAPVPALEPVRVIVIAPDMLLSPNGTVLYIPANSSGTLGADAELMWVNRRGEAVPVDPGWRFEYRGGEFALSPDGRRVAVCISDGETVDIWVRALDRAGASPVRLTSGGTNRMPEWTADGQSVFYSSNREPDGSTGTFTLRRRRADGSGPEELLGAAARPVNLITRTSDSTVIVQLGGTAPPALALWRPGEDSIAVVMEAARQAALSPDGKWLAYVSEGNDRNGVYVRPYPPTVSGGPWQVAGRAFGAPTWGPGGRELFYVDSIGHLVSAPVLSGPSFAIGPPRTLVSAQSFVAGDWNASLYAAHPDGQRFLFLRPVQTEPQAGMTRLVLVENALADLARPGTSR